LDVIIFEFIKLVYVDLTLVKIGKRTPVSKNRRHVRFSEYILTGKTRQYFFLFEIVENQDARSCNSIPGRPL
jgi:hypothetical protein